jgi:broad specificity phosphatase PhoE
MAAAAPRADRAAPDSSVTTIVLVRHAERDDRFVGSDPPLTREGRARAGALAHVLQDFGIASIYVTEFTRTRETAEPLAKLLGDSLRVLRGQDFATQAARIVGENRGRAALVVGHSNTVPQLIQAMTGDSVAIGHDAFDPLYVVVLYPGGTKLLRLDYGEASPRP